MRKILAALFALSLALPGAAMPPKNLLRPSDDIEQPQPPDPQPPAPQPPAPTAPPLGTTVLVPPLITTSGPQPVQAMRVLRLPVEAGKVSKIVATSLLAHGKSWIAKGHRYYSLCTPDGPRVACAPLVATATMKDIEVDAYDDNGEPKISFRIARGTTQDAKRLIATMNYFLYRTGKQVAHFDRKAASRVLTAPAQAAPAGGRNVPTLIDAGGGGCSYDDFGSYDCSGGDSGANGAGYDDDSYDWGNDYFGDEDNWDDPATSNLPSFPSGSDSGDADPCMDAAGNNVCQQVVITGERPDEMALPVCTVTPWAIACGRPPPPVFDPAEQLPKAPTPWLSQGACDVWSALCSAGQVSASERPPPLSDEERRRAARMRCYRQANAALTTCHDLRQFIGEREFEVCKQNALQQGRECGTIGMDR